MYEPNIWTHAPSWAIAGSELLPALDLCHDSQSSPDQNFADALLFNAGRRGIHEMEEVRRVSARLFPRHLPELASLTYAAVCVEARHAGGDFYDFFDRDPHRLGFAIGDVSGKGMASALVRATLQASLRTVSKLGIDDFEQSMMLVNRLLFESTPEPMYATLFLAEYDELSRKIRYVNCGHPAPLLYGQNGVSRLDTTSQVLGLFSDWKGSIGEVQLRADDILLVYTDGITEASNDTGEEFGESRLLALLQTQSGSLPGFLQQCVQEVCRFGASDQRDDLTLVALRGLEV